MNYENSKILYQFLGLSFFYLSLLAALYFKKIFSYLSAYIATMSIGIISGVVLTMLGIKTTGIIVLLSMIASSLMEAKRRGFRVQKKDMSKRQVISVLFFSICYMLSSYITLIKMYWYAGYIIGIISFIAILVLKNSLKT